jgi:hypothetical protein
MVSLRPAACPNSPFPRLAVADPPPQPNRHAGRRCRQACTPASIAGTGRANGRTYPAPRGGAPPPPGLAPAAPPRSPPPPPLPLRAPRLHAPPRLLRGPRPGAPLPPRPPLSSRPTLAAASPAPPPAPPLPLHLAVHSLRR